MSIVCSVPEVCNITQHYWRCYRAVTWHVFPVHHFTAVPFRTEAEGVTAILAKTESDDTKKCSLTQCNNIIKNGQQAS